MHKQFDLSIIIIQYNNHYYTLECIKSILTYAADIYFEIILIDNHSDYIGESELKNIFPELVLVKNHANEGFAKANNMGLHLAKGKYVLFLNNDTLFYENTLKNILNFAESSEGHLLIGCKLLNSDHSLQNSFFDLPTVCNVISSNLFLYKIFPNNRKFNKYLLYDIKIDQICEVDVVTGAFIFCLRDDLLALNGFDERFFFYAEEMDLCRRFRSSIGKVIYNPESGIIHYGSASADTVHWFKYLNQHTSTIKYYQKHFRGMTFVIVVFAHYLGTLIRVPMLFFMSLLKLKTSYSMRAIYSFRALFSYPRNSFR